MKDAKNGVESVAPTGTPEENVTAGSAEEPQLPAKPETTHQGPNFLCDEIMEGRSLAMAAKRPANQ